jgi:hypothetical protein
VSWSAGLLLFRAVPRSAGSRFAVELLALLLLLAAAAADRGAFGISESSTVRSSVGMDPGGSSPDFYRSVVLLRGLKVDHWKVSLACQKSHLCAML